MKKESRVVLTESQHEALVVASDKYGMPLATFLRWAALQYASKIGVHAEQPKAD